MTTKSHNAAQGLKTLNRATVTSSKGISQFTVALGGTAAGFASINSQLSKLNFTGTFKGLEDALGQVKSKIDEATGAPISFAGVQGIRQRRRPNQRSAW